MWFHEAFELLDPGFVANAFTNEALLILENTVDFITSEHVHTRIAASMFTNMLGTEVIIVDRLCRAFQSAMMLACLQVPPDLWKYIASNIQTVSFQLL